MTHPWDPEEEEWEPADDKTWRAPNTGSIGVRRMMPRRPKMTPHKPSETSVPPLADDIGFDVPTMKRMLDTKKHMAKVADAINASLATYASKLTYIPESKRGRRR